MKLIADCGSTKIDWAMIQGHQVTARATTTGMNALMLTDEEMASTIERELLPQIDSTAVTEIYYYGAGIIGEEVTASVRRALQRNFPGAGVIEIASDLLAAARAVCGTEPGIACIMGTGSNSCYYDGHAVRDNVSPLGYILGDEGSGAVLGKLLVGDVLKRQLPDEVCRRFDAKFGLSRLDIIQRVYKQPAANRFLASLVPFIGENIDVPEVRQLVLNAFKAFFRRNVASYPQSRELPVNFVGSIAFIYRDILEEAAQAYGMRIGTVIQSPIEGLINYHAEN